MNRIPLTKSQAEILGEFYVRPNTLVLLDRSKRKEIWDGFKKSRHVPNIGLDKKCPALLAELNKALDSGNLVQSAVFSECVYAQTLANMFSLDEFSNYALDSYSLPLDIVALIESYHLKPRYVYKSSDGRRILIQAGGNAGIDSALFTVQDKKVFTIEFKEPGAKTSEPDLPAYGEDGYLTVTSEFLANYPQFDGMLKEQLNKKLNFWTVMGSNVNDFTLESIQMAVSENYSAKKYADVICVEDAQGYLTMMPANQVGMWSNTQGEIRPAGRNAYAVWTPKALEQFIEGLGGQIRGGEVSVPAEYVATSSQRGGNSDVSRYKLNSLFFVRVAHVKNVSGILYFMLEKVKQLKPTIAAKMFFTDLSVDEVRAHYSSEL